MALSAASYRKELSKNGVFYTDLRLAEMLKEILCKHGEVTEVYDPTCGSGNLLSVFPDDVRKYGQELDPGSAKEAEQRLTNAEIVCGDTLTAPAFTNKRFKHITANYPFSVCWTPAEDERWSGAPCLPPPAKADYAFIMHIISMMADDGIAAVLGFPGILYRGQREGKIREWIVEQNLIESVTLIEGGYFDDTKVATALVVFRKGRTDTSIRFADHEAGTEYTATIDEVRKNGYTLSPSTYIPASDTRSEIDPVAKETEARAAVLSRIEGQIKFSIAAIEVHQMLGLPPLPPLSEFLNDIRKIISKYE